MASGSRSRSEAGLPSMRPDFRDAEAIPDEAIPLLLGLKRLRIELPDLMRWYPRIRDDAGVDDVAAPQLVPRAEDGSAHHQMEHHHEQHLHDDGIPGPAPLLMPLTTHRLAVAPTFFCPFPGCRKLMTYVNIKACKRHAESHWVRYTCPRCSKISSRLDHFREHERTDKAHGCGGPKCTHADDAVNIIDEWRLLGCGFCWKVFAVRSQHDVPLHLNMHRVFGKYTRHVFAHMSNGDTRAQWSHSCVIWSLLHGPDVIDAWTALYTRESHCTNLYAGPMLMWEDRAAINFIRRLKAGENGAILLEMLHGSLRPPIAQIDTTTNADLNASPYSVTVSDDPEMLLSAQQALWAESHVHTTEASSLAYPEVSSSWRSDAGNYEMSSPYPGVSLPSGRISNVLENDAFRISGESGPDQYWPNNSPTEEDVAQVGTHFPGSEGTAIRDSGSHWSQSMNMCLEPIAMEGSADARPSTMVPAHGRRRDALAAGISKLIQRPDSMISPVPSPSNSDASLPNRRHRRGKSWSDKLKRISRSSTLALGLRRERQPTD
ncbi:hypothetical protein LTR95_003324 [Oleoguttula sp. CCFEE 5521]